MPNAEAYILLLKIVVTLHINILITFDNVMHCHNNILIMKRLTIIYALVDNDNKKFVIRNRNSEDFNRKFQEVLSLAISSESSENIDHINATLRLNDFIDDDKWKIIALFDAKNNYNRDQKVINERKNFWSKEFEINGYTEDIHLDYDDSEISYNNNIIKTSKNIRDLSVIYIEKRKQLEKDYEEKQKALEKDYQEKLENDKKEILEHQRCIYNKKKQLDNELKEYSDKINFEKQQLDIRYKDAVKNIENADEYVDKKRQEWLNIHQYINSLKKEEDIIKKHINDLKEKYKECKWVEDNITKLEEERDEVKRRLIKTYSLKQSNKSEKLINQAIEYILNNNEYDKEYNI